MNKHKIASIFLYALGIVSIGYIEIILLIKMMPNFFLLNILAGGLFGALLSFLIFEIKEIVNNNIPGTLDDILRSLFFFIFIFSCLTIIIHL